MPTTSNSTTYPRQVKTAGDIAQAKADGLQFIGRETAGGFIHYIPVQDAAVMGDTLYILRPGSLDPLLVRRNITLWAVSWDIKGFETGIPNFLGGGRL